MEEDRITEQSIANLIEELNDVLNVVEKDIKGLYVPSFQKVYLQTIKATCNNT